MPGSLILAVIPARFQSTRLPGKPLLTIGRRTMLEHVWRRACGARLVQQVVIATDDRRIYDAARAFGAQVVMTDPAHATGADRVAEAAAASDARFIVNVQGDEPFLPSEAIDQAVAPLLAGGGTPMATLKTPFRDAADAASPNAVKVVTDRYGRALYFSRLPIPCLRDGPRDAAANGRSAPPQWYKHLGLYVYQRDFLLNYSNLPRGPLETAEKLEQLRALENGYPIQVVETPFDSVGVDTEEDLARARAQAVED